MLIIFEICVLKSIVKKNHIARNGQKGIWVSNFIQLFLTLLCIINATHIILHTKYVIISHGKLRLIQSISHIIIAILKSHHHIHDHPEINICKKKNVNIANTHVIQSKIAISDKLTHVNILNK
jgi:hypothetical protein